MQRDHFPGKVKVYFVDLLQAGIVSSRSDLHYKNKAGRIRPPYKEGDKMQSRAFWLNPEINEDINRELDAFARERTEAA
jgi:hypothetical protein